MSVNNEEYISLGRIKGYDGDSAYEVAVANGYEGTESEWLASLVGTDGDDGLTFTPSVSADGELSWTNDGGLSNPTTVNIKGADGLTTSVTLNGTTYTQENGNIDLGDVAFDLVIRTQDEFETMLASETWLDATSVCFVGDGGTTKFIRSDGDGVVIPETVKQISGLNDAIILITGANFGFGYQTLPTGNGYCVRNLTVQYECPQFSDVFKGAFVNFPYVVDCMGFGLNGTASGNDDPTVTPGFSACLLVEKCLTNGYFSSCNKCLNCNSNHTIGENFIPGYEADSVVCKSPLSFQSCYDSVTNCKATMIQGYDYVEDEYDEATVYKNCNNVTGCSILYTFDGMIGYTGHFIDPFSNRYAINDGTTGQVLTKTDDGQEWATIETEVTAENVALSDETVALYPDGTETVDGALAVASGAVVASFDTGTSVITLDDIGVGSTFVDSQNNSFRVVKMGYNNGNGNEYSGYYVVCFDGASTRTWNSTDVGLWKDSSMDSYLNGGFYDSLDDWMKNAIITVDIESRNDVNSDEGETETIQRKIFLASLCEAFSSGVTGNEGSHNEFKSFFDGEAAGWTRTSANNAKAVMTNTTTVSKTGSRSFVPLFLMPADTVIVSAETTEISYETIGGDSVPLVSSYYGTFLPTTGTFTLVFPFSVKSVFVFAIEGNVGEGWTMLPYMCSKAEIVAHVSSSTYSYWNLEWELDGKSVYVDTESTGFVSNKHYGFLAFGG